MLEMKSTSAPTGYTAMVDYWSLGVTMYKLLSGKMPFHNTQICSFVDYISKPSSERAQQMPNYLDEYDVFLRHLLCVSENFASDTSDIIARLLSIDYRTRLGYGHDGVKEMKSHAFFKAIEWNLLAQKHVVPPYAPSAADAGVNPDPSNEPLYESFLEMILAVRKADWIFSNPKENEQAFFSTWYVHFA
jgi:serine/threonine protein kinase